MPCHTYNADILRKYLQKKSTINRAELRVHFTHTRENAKYHTLGRLGFCVNIWPEQGPKDLLGVLIQSKTLRHLKKNGRKNQTPHFWLFGRQILANWKARSTYNVTLR